MSSEEKNGWDEDVTQEILEEVAPGGKKQLFGFYEKLRNRLASYGEAKHPVMEYLFLLPDLFILILRLLAEKRIPLRFRIFIGSIVGYLLLPIDIIPDFIPFIGYIDDLLIVVFGLNTILNDVDPAILEQNWSGERNLLHSIREITEQAYRFVGKKNLDKIRGWIHKNVKATKE